MSVRQIRLVVPGSHAEQLGRGLAAWMRALRAYDAVETDWKSGTVPTETIKMFGWCKRGSADVLGNTRLSAMCVFFHGHISGNLTAFPDPHDWDYFSDQSNTGTW